MTTQSRLDNKRARAYIDSIDYLRMKADKPRMEGQQFAFMLLLAAAGDEGLSMTAVANRLGVDNSFVSRNTKAFGPQVMRAPLVVQRIDPMSPKFRLVALTEEGHRLVNEADAIACGELEFDRSNGVARKARVRAAK